MSAFSERTVMSESIRERRLSGRYHDHLGVAGGRFDNASSEARVRTLGVRRIVALAIVAGFGSSMGKHTV